MLCVCIEIKNNKILRSLFSSLISFEDLNLSVYAVFPADCKNINQKYEFVALIFFIQ